jgi:hypothetical protein
MVLVRALGWLLLAFALAVAVRDALFWWTEGTLRLYRLGDLWLQLDFASLQSLESFVVGHVSALVWSRLAAPVLNLPALPVFGLLGLFLVWRSQRREEPTRPGFLLTSRPRRRRRRGSLS